MLGRVLEPADVSPSVPGRSSDLDVSADVSNSEVAAPAVWGKPARARSTFCCSSAVSLEEHTS